ncbi:hypothetical protein D3C84_754950 [compost metagenome]
MNAVMLAARVGREVAASLIKPNIGQYLLPKWKRKPGQSWEAPCAQRQARGQVRVSVDGDNELDIGRSRASVHGCSRRPVVGDELHVG